MLTIVEGDIFNSGCDVLVNPINCVGVMGAGLAKQFKQRNPEMFAHYKYDCENNFIQPGKCQMYESDPSDYDYWILNFPTKRHWREVSKQEYIEWGVDYFINNLYEYFKGLSFALPPLGCGLGGLSFKKDVLPHLHRLEKACPECKFEIWYLGESIL